MDCSHRYIREWRENLQFLTITYHKNKYWAKSGKQKSIFRCAIAISCSQTFEFIVVELSCSSDTAALGSINSRSENLCIYGWTYIFYGIWMVCILHFIIYTINGCIAVVVSMIHTCCSHNFRCITITAIAMHIFWFDGKFERWRKNCNEFWGILPSQRVCLSLLVSGVGVKICLFHFTVVVF